MVWGRGHLSLSRTFWALNLHNLPGLRASGADKVECSLTAHWSLSGEQLALGMPVCGRHGPSRAASALRLGTAPPVASVGFYQS